MKSKKEIEAQLEKLKSDVRLTYPTATTFENAPLALHQLAEEMKIHALEWVLGLLLASFPLKLKKK